MTTFELGGTPIETPAGRFILFGEGGLPTALSNSLGKMLPLFNRQLDWLFISDQKVSGLGGIPAVYGIGSAMLNHDNPDPRLTDFIDALQASGVTLIHAEKGMGLDLGARARLELIDEDEGNLSILVIWGMARIPLLPRTQLSQTGSLASPSVIILSSASSARLLQGIEATVGVIEGRNPLANTGSRPTLLATNDRGWIEHITNGERLWVVRLGQPDTKRVRRQTAQVGRALIHSQALSEKSVQNERSAG